MIGDLDAFRARHPIRTWEEQPLVLNEPVERWEETSGSSGARKRIPYTRTLRHQFNRAIAPWIVNIFTTEPRTFAGEAYWSISPGAESDEAVLGPLQRRLVRAVQAVPSSVRLTSENFREETLHHLTRCRTLSLISVWHPSFLNLLVGDLDTEKTWPHLRVISCWADANAAAPAAALAKKFPHVTIQPKGLLSTEGCVTIPYDGANVLAYRSHFYEFRDGETIALARRARNRQTLRSHHHYRRRPRSIRHRRRRRSDRLLRAGARAPVHRPRASHLRSLRREAERDLRPRAHASRLARHAARLRHAGLRPRRVRPLHRDRCSSQVRGEHAGSRAPREPHYDLARRLGQLAPLRIRRVRNAAATYLRVKSATQTLGDIKIPALDRQQGWSEEFGS